MPVRPDRLEPEDFPVPFGRYTLLRLLGEGGMARVFEAELTGPEGFRKKAALKVIRSGIGRNEGRLRKALIKEARLGGLLHHPNVVETYDFGETEGQVWIAMEIVRGMGLDTLLGEGIELPPSIAMEISAQICQGLEHAHKLTVDGQPAPLVHRDLKPSNVMVARNGLVKVLDFGIAKATHLVGNTTETGMTKGTPAYMSPEQAAGDPVDARSDIFALGCIIYELITGQRFFQGDTVYAIMLQVIKVDDLMADPEKLAPAERIVPGISAVLRRCLVRDASERWSDAREVERSLRKLQGRLPLPGPIRDWIESREAGWKARTAELEALSLDATPAEGGMHNPRRIEGMATTAQLESSKERVSPPTVKLSPPAKAVTPPTRAMVPAAQEPAPDTPGPTRPVAAVPPDQGARKLAIGLGVVAAILAVIAGFALVRGGPEGSGVEDSGARSGGDAEVVDAVGALEQPRDGAEQPRDGAEQPATSAPADDLLGNAPPDATPVATPPEPRSEPTPPEPATAAPEPTPEPVARPEPTPRRPDPTPAPKAGGSIEHRPPKQAVVGAPNRLVAKVVDADCIPAVLFGPWSASDGDLQARVMSGTGDGSFEAELFIPYELAWRKGFRYVIRCGPAGSVQARWPAAGTHRVDALAR